MSAPAITSDEIRIYLMDKPEFNTLVAGVRWTDEQIDQAIINTIDYYNLVPPPIGPTSFTVETFPSRYLLLIGVSGYLLKSAAINQAGNQFTYTAEGLQVSDHDKAQVFAEMGAANWAEYTQLVKDQKIQINVSRCYGTKGSEYRYLRR